jgi:hypothetical protein
VTSHGRPVARIVPVEPADKDAIRDHHRRIGCSTTCGIDAYVSTSAPCSSSTLISRVCCNKKSMTTRVRGARLRRDGYTMWTGTRCDG